MNFLFIVFLEPEELKQELHEVREPGKEGRLGNG